MPRARPAAVLGDGGWRTVRSSAEQLTVNGFVSVASPAAGRPLVLSGLAVLVDLLSTSRVADLDVNVGVHSADPGRPSRPDGFEPAVRLGPGGPIETRREVVVEVRGPAGALDAVYAVHLAARAGTDGPGGRDTVVHHVVIGVDATDPGDEEPAGKGPGGEGPGWRPAAGRGERDGGVLVRPLRTHLLGPLDDPVDVVRRYALPHAEAGDVVVLGESPLAVMQGRFSDPANGRPGWLAGRAAQFMSGEGSVGTGPGLQAVVDEVGAPQVVAALAAGLMGKLAGRDGWFYRVAGRRSVLVDDVTGTLPPYDRLIVLGPQGPGAVCRRIRAATGLEAAVADANDLGAVDVVGASEGVDCDLVRRALRTNPAGNAEERTPLVLVRRVR